MKRTIPVFAVLAAIALALPASHAQTLTGAQAQKSPQAEVFLAYEKALLWQGIDAAGAYMTPKRLAEMKEMFKKFSFEEFQTETRKRRAQGEARRRQIENLVVDGDYAELKVINGPNDVDTMRLVKTKDGWKIATYK